MCLKFDLDLSGDVFPRHSGDIVHGSSSNLPCLRGSHDWTGATYVPSRQERGEGDEINTADAILPLFVATVTLRLLLWIWDYSHFETSKLPIWDNYYQFETTITSLKLLLPLLLLHLFPLHDSVPLLAIILMDVCVCVVLELRFLPVGFAQLNALFSYIYLHKFGMTGVKSSTGAVVLDH